MKLKKTRVTMPAACSRRVVTSALWLLLFTCVAVRPLAATLVHVQGPTVLQPGEFCSDHPDAAIATFEDADLDMEIRVALRASVGAQKDLTCGVISGLMLLDASRGGIKSLVGIQNLTGLTILELDDNPWITDISALSGLTSLKRLRLSGNSISDISALSGLTSLTFLSLATNSITDISALSGLTSLTYLHFGRNSVSDISALTGLTSLTTLRVMSNSISDVTALSGLTSLTDLRLMSNSISDIGALSGLTSVTTLRLQTNPDLTDIQPLLDNTGLGAGDRIWLSATGVSCMDLGALAAKGVRVRCRERVALPDEPVDHTMRQYQLEADGDAFRLVMKEVAQPVPGAQGVLVRVRATSLNYRDRTNLEGQRGGKPIPPSSRPWRNGLVPVGDGAGEVIALGPGVTRFQLGDRVVAGWSGQGGPDDGMLSEMVVIHEDGLVSIPDHLTFEEAATLPIAAVTAWNALFTYGQLQPGDFVLLEGTGGVSIFGLQFAVAAGARPIITSSSDAKLERARALGAFGTVNYRTNPDWQNEVRALTGNVGVAHLLEVVGGETFLRAVRTLGSGFHIAIIGGLSGGYARSVPLSVFERGGSVRYLGPGSRANFEAMNEFITEHQLRPVIDRVFSFEEAAAAYEYMASGRHFAKIVIKL